MTTIKFESGHSKLQENKELNFLLNHKKGLFIKINKKIN